MAEYRYRIKSTNDSSSKFGPCEVCGHHATEVFLQVEEQAYQLDALDLEVLGAHATPEERAGKAWTQYECKRYFGHEACLLSVRRDNERYDRHERYYATGGLAQDESPTASFERGKGREGS